MPPKHKEDKTSTEKHVKQIEAQLAEGEKIERMYRAFEGDIRVITKDHGK